MYTDIIIEYVCILHTRRQMHGIFGKETWKKHVQLYSSFIGTLALSAVIAHKRRVHTCAHVNERNETFVKLGATYYSMWL